MRIENCIDGFGTVPLAYLISGLQAEGGWDPPPTSEQCSAGIVAVWQNLSRAGEMHCMAFRPPSLLPASKNKKGSPPLPLLLPLSCCATFPPGQLD
jgi:hypothetical protein